MKREFFNAQYTALANAYTSAHKLTDETQDIYWEMLKDIPEKDFARAIKYCLGHSKFFPTIAELGETAFPSKRIHGPYNPYAESMIELGWQKQVEQIAETEKRKLERNSSVIRAIGDGKKGKS